MTRKRLGFAIAAILLTTLVMGGVVLAGDLFLHYLGRNQIGLNVWGYRGPSVGRKQGNEWRLAVLGESTAYGYGVRWDEAFPAYLQGMMNAPGQHPSRPSTVVNLAFNNEGAHSFKFTLEDYAYLKADAVLLYSGYNDLGGANISVFRHLSPVFRITGYLPLFPMVFRYQAMIIRAGGDKDAAYGQEKTTFRPDITDRATAGALEAAADISDSLAKQLEKGLPDTTVDQGTKYGEPCTSRWAHYCGEIYQTIALARAQGKTVLMTTQPYFNDLHREQQRRLHEFLVAKFGNDPGVQFADLGDAIDLKDPALCYDRMHLTAEGNRRIAAALLPYVQRLMK
jgi:lysophospholipase L1-like esterase